MFRSLLRTLPALSGNVKLECHISPNKSVNKKDKDTVVCRTTSASLYPISDNINKYGIKVNLLSSTYDNDIKNFYTIYSDNFYSSQYKYNKNEIEKIDYTVQTNERDKNFEFGCQRSLYSVTGSQFEFFAPIYIDCINDIPDEFVISLQIDNGIYKVNDKKIVIKIKDTIYNNNNEEIDITTSQKAEVLQYNTNMLFDYLYRYVISMNGDGLFSKTVLFNYNEQDNKLNVSNAIYYGIDLVRGGFTQVTDSVINNLYYNQYTINSFDDIVTSGFSRHKIVMKQIIPLCFSFNISDIFTESEIKRINLSRIRFSGKYCFNDKLLSNDNITPELYDFSLNYTDYNIPSDIFNSTNCKYEYKISDSSKNIMEQKFPALCEKYFWKYRFMNKISPNTTKWSLLASENGITNNKFKFPYIINNNTAFSLINSSSLKYGPVPNNDNTKVKAVFNKCAISGDGIFYDSNKIAEFGDNYYNLFTIYKQFYNFVLPTSEKIYNEGGSTVSLYNYDCMRLLSKNNNLTVFDNYIDIIKNNKYVFSNILYLTSNFYNKTVKTGDEKSSTILECLSDLNNDVSLSDIVNGKGLFSGFSYNDMSLSGTSNICIFDSTTDIYKSTWSTPVFNTVYHNGLLFELSDIYNTDGFIKLNESKFNKILFNTDSDTAKATMSITNKNGILNYINNRNFENFKKTQYITKFGVFVLPIMTVVTDTSNIYSTTNVFKYINENLNKKDSILTYSNILTDSQDKLPLYDINSMNTDIYNMCNIEDELYIKSKVTLDDILSYTNSETNISYYKDNKTGTISYIMSDSFNKNTYYSNLYVNINELADVVSSGSVEPEVNFSSKYNNIYYSYNDIYNTYTKLDSIDDIYGQYIEIKNVLSDLLECKTTTVPVQAIIPISYIYNITENTSNVLCYKWTDNENLSDETSVYILSYSYCTINNTDSDTYNGDVNYMQLYREVYTDSNINETYSYNRIFVDGSTKYTEVMNTNIYCNSIYNKENFININNIQFDSTISRNILSNYITEYNLSPTIKTSDDIIFNSNIMVQHCFDNEFSGNIIKDVYNDINVIWCDPYNMYEVLNKYNKIDTNKYKETFESIKDLINNFKKSGAVREFFCSFVNTEHIIKYLNTVCCGFVSSLDFMPAESETSLYNGKYCTSNTDSLYIKENKEAEEQITDLSLLTIPVTSSVKYTVINKSGETSTKIGLGGPFYNLYCMEKIITVDPNACLRSKYKYTRFYKYIIDKITDNIEKKYKNTDVNTTKTVNSSVIPVINTITATNFKKYIYSGDSNYMYNITINIDLYNAYNKVIETGVDITVKNILFVYKKEFIRTDEIIMEDIFKMYDENINITDDEKKYITDIYFSTPFSDDNYNLLIAEIGKKLDIISSNNYYDDLIKYTYTEISRTDDGIKYYVNDSYNDIIYKADDSYNLKPLYNSVYYEDKKITEIYSELSLNNIKKCTAHYTGIYNANSSSLVNDTVTNYRYGTPDLNDIVLINSVLLNNIINIYTSRFDTIPEIERNYKYIYENYISKFTNKVTVYKQYHSTNSVVLLKPDEDSELNSLGLADSNIFSYTINGENYGFYIIGTIFDNTKSSFDINCIDSISASEDDNNNIIYTIKKAGTESKTFFAFNNVPLIKYDNKSRTETVSLQGVQYCISSFNQIIPFFNKNVAKSLYNINTIKDQSRMNINIQYFQQPLTDNIITDDIKETNIVYRKYEDVKTSLNKIKTLKRHSLLRYWSYGIPSFVKLSDMKINNSFNYIYNTKRKDTDSILLKTGKYLSIGDCVIDPYIITDINEYPGINIYSKSDSDSIIRSFNNITIKSYKEPEYKHFNTSTFFCLQEEFIIDMPDKYIYNDILKMSAYDKKIQVFKKYINSYNKNRYIVSPMNTDYIISDIEILFLYGRYNCETLSNSAGINNNGERVYTFKYRFILK